MLPGAKRDRSEWREGMPKSNRLFYCCANLKILSSGRNTTFQAVRGTLGEAFNIEQSLLAASPSEKQFLPLWPAFDPD